MEANSIKDRILYLKKQPISAVLLSAPTETRIVGPAYLQLVRDSSLEEQTHPSPPTLCSYQCIQQPVYGSSQRLPFVVLPGSLMRVFSQIDRQSFGSVSFKPKIILGLKALNGKYRQTTKLQLPSQLMEAI